MNFIFLTYERHFTYNFMHITKLFLVDYMELIFNIILPELRLNYDPRWVVDVLQTGIILYSFA